MIKKEINEKKIDKYIDELIIRYPNLKFIKEKILNAYEILKYSYNNHGKLLIIGNGGSAADSEHIAGELMKKFLISRTIDNDYANKLKLIDYKRGLNLSKNLECALPAIPLVSHEAFITAYINDVNAECLFAQQVFALGKSEDVLLAISTSGNSENIINAAIVAKSMGIKVIGLTGQTGGVLSSFSDIIINVPETKTYCIQELHLPIYHCLCMMLEEYFFG